jgi:Ca2+-transporting ATPase
MQSVKINNWHSEKIEDLYEKYKSSKSGLSSKQAKANLAKFGENILAKTESTNLFLVFLKQFNSILIYFLFVAALISFIFDHQVDAIVILVIILVNGIIGFIQEFKAEKAIGSLSSMIIQKSKVLRNGEIYELESINVVPGDILILEEGDNIAADARIIEVKNFKTVEGSLTGESYPLEKSVKKLGIETALAERTNMVWMGTSVASGKAYALVVATGSETELGKIALNLKTIKVEKTHFEVQTNTLAKQMGAVALFGGILTFVIGYFVQGIEFVEIFIFTIASIVSAIPEGLPTVLVIVLAVGTNRMAKKNAIIRRLAATETLGVIDVIMTDKTGTLTQNIMTAVEIVSFPETRITVTGDGYIPEGKFNLNEEKINPLDQTYIKQLLEICGTCNSAKIYEEDGVYKSIGDPTEVSLLVLAEKSGLDIKNLKAGILDDLSFNSNLKFRATLFKTEDSSHQIMAIGAPENLILRCKYIVWENKVIKLDDKKRAEFLSKIEKLSLEAKRVLSVAFKAKVKTSKIESDDVADLCMLGLVTIMDPPRDTVKAALVKARKAGIRVLMATGDHQNTAVAIANQIELKNDGSSFTDTQLRKLDDNEFLEAVLNTNIFARLTPDMKLRILSTLQDNGFTVAMTGDGVNDAPALKKADIGISMGITGTDVARESSEMVLADDNFASIISAVEEGRIVFTNTRQTSTFLITTNFAEIATILVTLFFGLPLPLIPIQILWLNLVTDTVASLALIFEPSHSDVLNEKPRKTNESLLGRDTIPYLILMTLVMSISTFLVFRHMLPGGLNKARTGAFLVMALTQLFNMVNMRSLARSAFGIGFFSSKFVNISLLVSIILLGVVMYVPFLAGLFSFEELSVSELCIVFLVSSSVLWAGEVYKLIKNRND